MGTLRAVTLAFGLALVACSSTNGQRAHAAPDGGGDASLVDAALGPLVCGIPVASTCPEAAPCAFAAWGCAAAPCEGYFVVSDGAWTYYYSANGGELVAELAQGDASFAACPYGFEPPAACAAIVASQCTTDGGATEAGAPD